ncbi:MAG: tyrosine-type recombinase/integrase [Syntrophobacteraceae bacterium]
MVHGSIQFSFPQFFLPLRIEERESLFYNETGKMVDINNLRKRVFYRALERAKLRRIRIHDLRHTYATLRISKGDNILDVSKQVGHSSVKITLDIYCHWMPGGKKSEVDELDSDAAPKTSARSVDTAENGQEFFCAQMHPICTQTRKEPKKGLPNPGNPLILLTRPVGFEPTTYGFVG